MKYLVTLSIVVLVHLISFSQQTFVYKTSAEVDYESIKLDEVKKLMRNVESELDENKFILSVLDNQSQFSVSEALNKDSQNLQALKIAEAMSYVSDQWFYDSSNGSLYLQTSFMNQIFNVQFKELPRWQIKNEHKVIGKYKVTKAVTIRKFIGSNGVKEKEIEAWFCKDISVPHGPMGAVGLPGLVVQLRLQNTIYTLDSVENTVNSLKKVNQNEVISSEKFYNLVDEKLQNYR
ncbi:MAG: GLPGLI family protein [Psychroflexus halocasei]|uniref:GLPGLI family protein n=1 Tax=Psychroflexus sp. S27 TaxID=1982757 RepID=UPI000C29C9EA|nr:GLPGLI family protein [Psychroflexus sp. S27]PJX22907.1 GLPGLI family protein [Psychroflexus sp. S27]